MAREDVGKLKGAARDAWFLRTPLEIEEERRRVEEAGRAAWNKATRTGQQVLARTQDELQALGRSELARQASQTAGQVGAVARAAANRATFGGADHFSAAADAALGFGEGDSFRDRYRSNLPKEQERTEYDAQHRPVAKAVGDLAGEALGFKGASKAGALGVGRLPPKAKGVVGEVLSAGKSVLKGDAPKHFQVRQKLEAGGHTVLDQITRAEKFVEAKFGPTARLSRRQRQAQAQYGDRYRVDHWQPHHVGRITGGVGAGAVGIYDDDDER